MNSNLKKDLKEYKELFGSSDNLSNNMKYIINKNGPNNLGQMVKNEYNFNSMLFVD